jgi:hypothetical protein
MEPGCTTDLNHRTAFRSLFYKPFISFYSNFSLVFVMIENEEASSELFAESLIVENILERSSAGKERESHRIPNNEFLEVSDCLMTMLHPVLWMLKVVVLFCSSYNMLRSPTHPSATKLEI